MKRLFIAVSIAAALFTSCSRPDTKEYAPAEVADLASFFGEYERLDSDSVASFKAAHAPEITALLKAASYSDTATLALAPRWAKAPAVSFFTHSADSAFESLDTMRLQLGHILGASADNGLELPLRRYAAVVYGRSEAILFVDSVMLVALNHFLGPEYEPYSIWPVYRRNEKAPQNMPYYMAEALIANRYPYSAEGADATLLSYFLYHGALTYAKMQTVPDARENLALGYNEADFQWINDNSEQLWRDMVAAGLLYDTSEAMASRFTSPSPAVRELANIYPGRIGRYIGYRLVKEYVRNHNEVTLAHLLSPDFYCAETAEVLKNATKAFK